ncbi:MAG: Nramp family divalent metal transporter, partial [Mycobacteriales bacterium]
MRSGELLGDLGGADGTPSGAGAGPETEPSALDRIRARGRIRGGIAILGPAFVAAAAYVDPGNFATSIAGGAEHGYALVWVVVVASVMAVLVQYLTSKLGIATGASLPELCARHYSRHTNLALWVQAEAVAMATDLAEFVGAALGLHLVFGVPLFPAGLITAVVAFAILALQRRGYRRFEIGVVVLLALVAAGFGYLFVVGGPSARGIAGGLVPHIPAGDGLGLAVGIVGATVMPHAVYLHSALQRDRIRPRDAGEARTLVRYNRLDCITGLGAAGLVNLAMLCVAAELFHGTASVTDLVDAHRELATIVGGFAALAFGVALLASGFASASVGTYAGQVVMGGFTGWRIPLVVRRAVTMAPSLLVLGLGVPIGSVLVYSQIALAFGIPFALVPLLLLTRSTDVMGELVNRRTTTAAMVAVAMII